MIFTLAKMEAENQYDDAALYNSQRNYRAPPKAPLGTMEIPAHLNKASTSRINVNDRRQLEARQKKLPHLEQRAMETEQEHDRAQTEYLQYVELAKQYRDAENARTPTAEQSRVIREINESVRTINLTGPDDGTPELGRKMAERVLTLKKTMDAALASWNAAEKVNIVEITNL